MKKQKILLVGGSGYIGTHIYLALIEKGYDPVIFDNFYNSSEKKVKNLEKFINSDVNCFIGDILSASDIEKVFEDNNFSGVIHLAALKSVPDSNKDYINYYKTNILGLINLIHVMNKYNTKRLIFSSSATVYGENAISPVNESMKTFSNNTYGLTKIIGEDILENTCKVDKEWSAISLRYFNPAGSREYDLLREEPKKSAGNLFPIIENCLLDKDKKFNIFGNDYKTPDGTPMRDFIHIDDLANSHVLALMKLETDTNYYNAINIGSGKPRTVLEIVKKFEEITNKKLNIVFNERRENDIGSSYADISLAKKELGFEPAHDLDSICRSSIKV